MAARRLARPWAEFDAAIADAETRAAALLPDPVTDASTKAQRDALHQCDTAAKACEMSHHARLATATKWSRSCNAIYITKAVELLEQLKHDYPHVLEIDEELALAYLELDRDDEAERVLASLGKRHRNLHEETYCRIGRVWKQRGEKIIARSGRLDDPEALSHFQRAHEQYHIAYKMRDDYYPGINVAALFLFLGDGRQAKATAEDILRLLSQQSDRGDLLWRLAAQGEAHLILEDCEAAEQFYESAVEHQSCDPHCREPMFRQARKLIDRSIGEVRKYWQNGRLDEVFRRNPSAG